MPNAFRLEDFAPRPTRSADGSTTCEAVRFYGRELHIALSKAAEYLRAWERAEGCAPSIVALHDEFSWEDANADIAWQLTLVLSGQRSW
ncbi:MAG TPA: hypothetical protein VMB79_18680 [Jatrophihabitans sp.]|nr:hypothetical protein [Jatrophihabitans sp.]